MRFISSRSNNPDQQVPFSEAVLKCFPSDGGLYVPAYAEDLSPWINYMTEETSFTSMAGSLTQALIKEEFSPIISEAIATSAFPFSPKLRRLDDSLYVLELFHGPTGCYKDFGISYLAACMDHMLLMQNRKATVLAVTNGETGACIANAFRGRKNLKAVLFFTKGTTRGFAKEDMVQNGGNILPIEVEGDTETAYQMVRQIYAQPELVEKYGLTLANTVNIGRVLPLVFCYVYAFSRLKSKTVGSIYYSGYAGNLGNIAAGLYAWKFALPLNGFITNTTSDLILDQMDKCKLMDSVVPLRQRGIADVAKPSNVERIEEIFHDSPAVLKGLVFPANVYEEDQERACKDAFMKYGYMMDGETASAWAAARKRSDLVDEYDGSVVLLARNDPSLSQHDIRHWCGEAPEISEKLFNVYMPCDPAKTIPPDVDAAVSVMREFLD